MRSDTMTDAPTPTAPSGRTDQGLEIWPGVPSTIPGVAFDLVRISDGAPLGALYLTSDLTKFPTYAAAGWVAKAQYWVWDDPKAGVDGWPDVDFQAKDGTDLDSAPSAPPAVAVRTLHAFKPTQGTTDLDGASTPVYATASTQAGLTSPIGYVKVATNGDDSLKVYSCVSGAIYIANTYDDTLYFGRQPGPISFASYGYRHDTVID